MANILSRLGIVASVSFLLGQAALVAPAQARDDVILVTVADAMATPDAKEKLDGSVKFYFGASPHPAIVHKFGDLTTNDKTNSLGKSALKACNWVFLSALLKFQERAQQLGANGVVNIVSFYKRESKSYDTQAECHSGVWTTGVALKGDFVKLAGH